ncbi:hypothetical protein BGZ76_000532 [Entomortierella beljakovae]|nr:hypothetical protein BGZ76_000532 [Entomortierella beljakovae]
MPVKAQTGFRFQFRDAEEEDWENFKTAFTESLDDINTIHTFGLRHLDDTTDEQFPTQLRHIDLNRVWSWYSKKMMKCAKDNLPGKVVGKSGVKPEAELSLLHIIRSCARLKKQASMFQKSPDGIQQETLNAIDTKLREQMDKYNLISPNPLPVLDERPHMTDESSVWKNWTRHIKYVWGKAINMLQTERALIQRSKIREAIDNRCEQMTLCTSKMLDSVLDRHRGKVVIDRVQQLVGNNTVNVQETEAVKEVVRKHFNEWHKERTVLSLDSSARWMSQYSPKEWIKEEWYDGLMDLPSVEEFEKVLHSVPKGKASGETGTSNELFTHQGKLGDYMLFQIICACLIQEEIPIAWKTGIIYCIPKAAEWSGNLAEEPYSQRSKLLCAQRDDD